MLNTMIGTALLIGGGYGVLMLFSRLTGVDMPAAMCWGFRTRHLEVVLPWCLIYVIAFVMVMALLHKPYNLWHLSRSHTAALQGYAMSDGEAKLYDPVEKQYAVYPMTGAAPAAKNFKETFDLVTLYRPFASSPYHNAPGEGIWVSLIVVFFAAGSLVLLYLITYGLAGLHIEKTGLAWELTHRLVLHNFGQLTGYPLLLVLAVFALFVLATSLAGGSLVNRITREYEERYVDLREAYRRKVLSAAVPGTVLKGRVVNRVRDAYKINGSRGAAPPDDQDRTVPRAIYTIEFKGLTRHVPVYLGIRYVGEPDAIPDRQMLDALFPPERSLLSETQRDREPREMRELDFLVNEDYSVSLVQ